MFTVYVLYSAGSKKHYTGFTSNLGERMKSHNELGKDWTKSFRPWHLIYTKKFEIKAEATQYEARLKTEKGREFMKTLSNLNVLTVDDLDS